MEDTYPEVRNTLILIFILNIAVALAKAIFGLLANSLSMIADSAHSLFDSLSNVIGLIGVWIASKPPDREHPYGHRKYETFASIGIALLLVVTAFGILQGAVGRILNPLTPEITRITFGVMLATTLTNIFVSVYERRKGEKLHSPILVADSLHTRSDVYASISVMLGFIAINFGYPVFDPLIALLIAALIARTAFGIIKGCSIILCDTYVVDEHVIIKIVKSIRGIKGCHKIRTRGSKHEIYVDLHILVKPDMSVVKAHELSEMVEQKLKSEIEGVKDVVVHIEPSSK
jgi:cation diffusion facilitator family transporter